MHCRQQRPRTQSVYRISYTRDPQVPTIHSRITTQLDEKQKGKFTHFMRNKILRLKDFHVQPSKPTIKLYMNNPKTLHDIYTDAQGKKILQLKADTHMLNLQFLSRFTTPTSHNLGVSGKGTIVRQCRFHTEEEVRTQTHTPLRRKPQLTPTKNYVKKDEWKDVNAWQTDIDSISVFH